MAPRRKRKSDIDRVKKLAEKLGINFDNLMDEVSLTDIGEQAKERRTLEAESVIFYIQTKGKNFAQKNCDYCKHPFLSTYAAVAYCSDECRANWLAERGVIWNARNRPDVERWAGKIPKVISSEATGALVEAGHNYNNIELPKEDEVNEDG